MQNNQNNLKKLLGLSDAQAANVQKMINAAMKKSKKAKGGETSKKKVIVKRKIQKKKPTKSTRKAKVSVNDITKQMQGIVVNARRKEMEVMNALNRLEREERNHNMSQLMARTMTMPCTKCSHCKFPKCKCRLLGFKR